MSKVSQHDAARQAALAQKQQELERLQAEMEQHLAEETDRRSREQQKLSALKADRQAQVRLRILRRGSCSLE
jgi:hypothetical protein